MANTQKRSLRTLAWLLAIVMTVFSMPVFPLGISLFNFQAQASTFDGRDRLGVWWWYEADGTNASTRDNYLNVCEQMGATEIYYYCYGKITNPTSSNLASVHTFVQAAMTRGMRVSVMIDDPALVTNASTSKSTIQKLRDGMLAYRAAYPSDWLYGIHYDCEPGGYDQTLLQNYVNNVLHNSLTYLIPNNIYCEFDVNPTWNSGVNCTYTYNGTNYTGFYRILANTLANGRGCVSLMSYRTTAANIYKRANEGTEKAVTQCINANCDVTVGMECTAGEGSSVSLPDAGITTKAQVETIIDGLQALVKSNNLPGDSGVTVHHARSFCQNMSGNFVTPESYTGGGATQTRVTDPVPTVPQTTTTTRNTSGMTLTKQALYYKGGLNVTLADYDKYTDTAMTAAIMTDYAQNGIIDSASGEYYEFKVTGRAGSNDYLYPIVWASGSEVWAGSYPNGTEVSTAVSTIVGIYGKDGLTNDPIDMDFGTGAQFGVSLENGGTYTLNEIEVNVYRFVSGGGPTQPSQTTPSQTSPSQSTTTTVNQGGSVVSGNLIINGDFSNGFADWHDIKPSSAFSVTGGALQVNTAGYYQDITAYAAFNTEVVGGKTYTLRFEGSGNVSVKIHNNIGDGGYTTYSEPGTYTFTVASGMSSTDTDYKMRFDVFVSGPKDTELSGTFDNFILVEGDHIPEGGGETSQAPTTYTVTVNGGTADKTTVAAGETVTITAGGPAVGMSFKNWTTADASLANANNAVTSFTMPAKNVTVTANYQAVNYTVAVSLGTANKYTATYGETVTLTASAPASGMEFDKWVTKTGSAAVSFANASSANATFLMPAGNVSVEATYKAKKYTVTVNSGTANKYTASSGETVTVTANAPANDKVFDKWTTSDGVSFANASSATTTFQMPAKNVTVTATYKQLYTVTVNGGTASPATAAAGTSVTLTPESRGGFTFNGWTSSDVSITNNTFTMPAKNVTVTANFTQVNVDPDPPATPALVSATADGSNIVVRWNAVAGVAGYRVYRKSGGGAYATVTDINSGNIASYTDEALAKGTYTYTVQAYVNGTSGKIWGDYNATGKTATVTFGAPTLTSAVASAAGITVTWQKVNGATGYRLYRKDGSAWVTVKTLADVNTVSYLAKGLVAGEVYTYTVQAYYDSTLSGTTQWSDYDNTGVSATAQFGAPETEGQADGMKITITWAAVQGAEGYRIYRKTADTSWRTIATVNASSTSYTDENPVANIYYTYTVQAYTTEGGQKIYSTYDATGTTKRVVLGTPTLSDAEVTGEGVVVSWEAVTGATGYRLYRFENGRWKTVKTVIGINTVSYTDKNAKAVAGAKYTVQAFRNADGVNVWSDHVEAGVTAN